MARLSKLYKNEDLSYIQVFQVLLLFYTLSLSKLFFLSLFGKRECMLVKIKFTGVLCGDLWAGRAHMTNDQFPYGILLKPSFQFLCFERYASECAVMCSHRSDQNKLKTYNLFSICCKTIFVKNLLFFFLNFKPVLNINHYRIIQKVLSYLFDQFQFTLPLFKPSILYKDN